MQGARLAAPMDAGVWNVVAVLRQLPSDVVDSNILQKLRPADLRSLRESSPAAAELVRHCKGALALSRQPADGDVSTEAVAKVLAAYAAVSTLKLSVKSTEEALELLVMASCATKLFTALHRAQPRLAAMRGFAAPARACVCLHTCWLAGLPKLAAGSSPFCALQQPSMTARSGGSAHRACQHVRLNVQTASFLRWRAHARAGTCKPAHEDG